jgi:hypothetical protein
VLRSTPCARGETEPQERTGSRDKMGGHGHNKQKYVKNVASFAGQ